VKVKSGGECIAVSYQTLH